MIPAPADVASPPADAKPAAEVKLDAEQQKLASKYADLEKAMSRMTEVLAATDPKRSGA